METNRCNKYTLLQTQQIYILKVEVGHSLDQSILTRYFQFNSFESMVNKENAIKNSSILNVFNALENEEVYPERCLGINSKTQKVSFFPQLSDLEDQEENHSTKAFLKKKHIQKAKKLQKQQALKTKISQLEKQILEEKKSFQKIQKEHNQAIQSLQSNHLQEIQKLKNEHKLEIQMLELSYQNHLNLQKIQQIEKVEFYKNLYFQQNKIAHNKNKQINRLNKTVRQQKLFSNQINKRYQKAMQMRLWKEVQVTNTNWGYHGK